MALYGIMWHYMALYGIIWHYMPFGRHRIVPSLTGPVCNKWFGHTIGMCSTLVVARFEDISRLTFSPKATRRYSPEGCRETASGESWKKLISSDDLSRKFQSRRALSTPTVATCETIKWECRISVRTPLCHHRYNTIHQHRGTAIYIYSCPAVLVYSIVPMVA